ncbi:hypothetical protein XACW160_460004 [Xanthomonas citri pv. citri]|nr:hypothetical protein XACW160_460004 [Xanthomonas citri pv. citri]
MQWGGSQLFIVDARSRRIDRAVLHVNGMDVMRDLRWKSFLARHRRWLRLTRRTGAAALL